MGTLYHNGGVYSHDVLATIGLLDMSSSVNLFCSYHSSQMVETEAYLSLLAIHPTPPSTMCANTLGGNFQVSLIIPNFITQ